MLFNAVSHRATCLMNQRKTAVWLTQHKLEKSLTVSLRSCGVTDTVVVIYADKLSQLIISKYSVEFLL